MSYRTKFETIVVDAGNLHQFPGCNIGDVVQIRHETTEVDLRPFAQLAESLGQPYPDDEARKT